MASPYNKNTDYLAAGIYGSEYITDTAVHGGPFGAIFALEDTVIDACDSPGVTGTTMAAMALGDGKTIFGEFRNLQLTSGRVWAYKFGA